MSDLSNDFQVHSKKQKLGLGRGLGSLLGGGMQQEAPTNLGPSVVVAPTPENDKNRVWSVPIEKLIANEYQPRKFFSKEKLEELCNSIKENGIVQPIVARKKIDGRLEIIAGERRWRASQLAGLHEVPVIVKEVNDQDALEIALIENIQMEDLNPIEEAEAYQRLASEFNLTQAQVAEKVGKDRTTVANAIRLLALPEILRKFLAEGLISTGHAKAILAIPDIEKQIELGKRIVKDKLSVRTAEKMASEIMVAPKGENTALDKENVTARLIQGLADEMKKVLGTKVNIEYQDNKGKISIHFYSDEQLTNIIERLRKG